MARLLINSKRLRPPRPGEIRYGMHTSREGQPVLVLVGFRFRGRTAGSSRLFPFHFIKFQIYFLIHIEVGRRQSRGLDVDTRMYCMFCVIKNEMYRYESLLSKCFLHVLYVFLGASSLEKGCRCAVVLQVGCFFVAVHTLSLRCSRVAGCCCARCVLCFGVGSRGILILFALMGSHLDEKSIRALVHSIYFICSRYESMYLYLQRG